MSGGILRRAEVVLRCATDVAHVPCWGGGMSASKIEWTESYVESDHWMRWDFAGV